MISLKMPSNIPAAAAFSRRGSTGYSTYNPRYLGEASDVRFFHTIKKFFRDEDQSGGAATNDTQSYDQGILHLETHDGRESQTDLPTKSMADTYIEIYFFTILIAYPFLSKPSFMARYERFWNGEVDVVESPSWLPLLCKWLLTLQITEPILTYPRHYLRHRRLLYILSPRRKCQSPSTSPLFRASYVPHKLYDDGLHLREHPDAARTVFLFTGHGSD